MMEEIGSPILAFSIPKADILKKLDPPVQIKFEIKKVFFYLHCYFYVNPYSFLCITEKPVLDISKKNRFIGA